MDFAVCRTQEVSALLSCRSSIGRRQLRGCVGVTQKPGDQVTTNPLFFFCLLCWGYYYHYHYILSLYIIFTMIIITMIIFFVWLSFLSLWLLWSLSRCCRCRPSRHPKASHPGRSHDF